MHGGKLIEKGKERGGVFLGDLLNAVLGIEAGEAVDVVALAAVALAGEGGKRGGVVEIVGFAAVEARFCVRKTGKERIALLLGKPEQDERLAAVTVLCGKAGDGALRVAPYGYAEY